MQDTPTISEPRWTFRRVHPVVAAVLTFWTINALIWAYVALIVTTRHMIGVDGPTGG